MPPYLAFIAIMGCQLSKGFNSVAPVLDSRSSYGHGKSGKAYVTFVSHFKMEAATDGKQSRTCVLCSIRCVDLM